jgi:Putative Ig domain/Concanavalin A-like lectin/glucanases superfamily
MGSLLLLGTGGKAGGVPAGPLAIGGTPVTTGIEYEHGIGSTYAGFTVTASGGTLPYTYSILSGTLPSGITLNSSSGVVSGTPAFESAGTYSGIVIRVTDGAAVTANLGSFTLTISYKDPYYSSTKVLLDHNAADATTTFTDASASARGNANAVGNVQHDTGVSPPYGTSWFLFDGSGDNINYGDSNDWNLGSSAFTWDLVIRPSNVTGTRFLAGQWSTTGNCGWVLYMNGADILLDGTTNGATTTQFTAVTATGALAINTTYFIRISFDGTKYRLFKDGTMIGSSTTLRTFYTGSTNAMTLGANAQNTSFFYAGWMKGVRFTAGVGRTPSDSNYATSNRSLPTS